MPTLIESPPKPASGLMAEFAATRAYSLELCAPLETEDLVVQTDFVVSPLKWHLGHTAWLFENFILKKHYRGYKEFHPGFHLLFNSYYTSAGTPLDKNSRGILSRPTVQEVRQYRSHVDAHMARLMEDAGAWTPELDALVELGIQHEKQHQELMLYDIKHILWTNPLKPAYLPQKHIGPTPLPAPAMRWVEFDGGVEEFGYWGRGFCYDNELPVHKAYLNDFALAARCVTNGEFLAFVEEGGYGDPRFWLANGWAQKTQQGWAAPLYWHSEDGNWSEYTMHGMEEMDPALPVCHLSHYEADAYARWAGCRLPTEHELEKLARLYPNGGNTVATRAYHPQRQFPAEQSGPSGVIGDVWEWTQSAYLPYPGYDFINNGLGEYNGKFMNNQIVLRGGSCMTPTSHLRYSYRNFFESGSRWQCSGIRLARAGA